MIDAPAEASDGRVRSWRFGIALAPVDEVAGRQASVSQVLET